MKSFATSDESDIAYGDDGSGPVLLCLAGLTRNSSDFDRMVAHLPDFRIIRPDYRGRGRSAWDQDYRNYSPAVEARDVVELLDHLGLEKVPILGTSRGGIVAMVLAATCRNRVASVILNDIGPELEQAGLDRIVSYLGRQPEASSLDEAARDIEAGAVGFSNVPRDRWIEECLHRYSFENGQPVLNYDPKLRDAVLESLDLTPVSLWPYFEALDGIPLALIRGENSDLLSREIMKRMQHRRPDMTCLEVADRGHCPFLDEPVCIEFIRNFMTR